MKNSLTVKEVNFNGATLMATQTEDGKIYVGVSYICKGIGLSDGQRDRQIKNIKDDEVLKQATVKFDGGVFDPINSTLGLELDFLPLWLAKINITPRMKEEQPQVTENLVTYQLKAKDVLSDAFIKKDIKSKKEVKQESVYNINQAVKIVSNLYDDLGVSSEYKFLATKEMYKKAGIELPSPRLIVDSPLFDLTSIAKELGIYSEKGKPHSNAIKAVIDKIKVEEDEREIVPYTRNGHSGTTLQYKSSVISKIDKWIRENNYPNPIKGKNNYKIRYRESN